ncbi:MAG TPA: TetR/AcrR family transcriptional regulator [Anaerolineae bacterium]|nr:TetR/AcrR family transcriptional regulator [Anaerolineae bacterium]
MDAQPLNRFERRKQRTRELLKQAAIELIVEKGYEAVTVEAITDRADMGRGTFYIHFQDKDDIIWSIVKDVIAAGDVEANNRYLIERPTHAEYLGVRLLFEYAGKRRDLYRILLGQQGSAALSSKLQHVIAAEIAREIRQSRVFKDIALPPQFTAQFVAGALVRLLTWWIETPDAYTADQMADMFYEMLKREPPRSPAST